MLLTLMPPYAAAMLPPDICFIESFTLMLMSRRDAGNTYAMELPRRFAAIISLILSPMPMMPFIVVTLFFATNVIYVNARLLLYAADATCLLFPPPDAAAAYFTLMPLMLMLRHVFRRRCSIRLMLPTHPH